MWNVKRYCGFCKQELIGGYATNTHGFYYHMDCWLDYGGSQAYKKKMLRRCSATKRPSKPRIIERFLPWRRVPKTLFRDILDEY